MLSCRDQSYGTSIVNGASETLLVSTALRRRSITAQRRPARTRQAGVARGCRRMERDDHRIGPPAPTTSVPSLTLVLYCSYHAPNTAGRAIQRAPCHRLHAHVAAHLHTICTQSRHSAPAAMPYLNYAPVPSVDSESYAAVRSRLP